jgi:uncharacterized protein YdhG (YjbR/CyaY superfamily)
MATAPNSVDQYIAGFPPKVRATLNKIRVTVRRAAPDAQERISYRMPSFSLNGVLIYFAAFQHHIGIYPPVPAELRKAASPYAGAKGNLRFPLDRPIPYSLISRIIKVRVRQHQSKKQAREKRK